MRDLSERERQDMIQRAKGGNPQANYELALWALDQAEVEPEEERWNRLAAKCLVRAAQGGYGPAIEHTAHLLHQTEGGEAEEPAPKSASAHPQDRTAAKQKRPAPRPAGPEPVDGVEDFDWDGYQEPERQRAPQAKTGPGTAAKAAAVAGMAGQGLKQVFRHLGTGKETPPREKKAGGHRVSSGGSHQAESGVKWRKIEIICIVACVLLALLITIMIVTGRKKNAEEEDASVVPIPVTEESVETPAVISAADYPSEDIKEEIASATLSVYPDDEDYVTEATTATVKAGSGLNLRRGPGTSFGQIILMDYGSSLEVYAYKNGWALVLYDGDTWGWCNQDYLN